MTYLQRIAPLFAGWEETMVWSCLQGVMGRAEANADGSAAMIVNRDFVFLAGRPDPALLAKAPGPILVPRTEDWNGQIEAVFGKRAVKEIRYAVKKEPDVFDREHLERLAAALPEGYTLRMIGEELVPVLLGEGWSKDFCSAFDSPADCCRRGVGVVAMYEGVPVAGAGSYCVYDGGIEIEIDTREDHRRRGLAAACGARLILECLARGWYPSWDAQNPWSASLARKLGYRPGHEYTAYEIVKSGT